MHIPSLSSSHPLPFSSLSDNLFLSLNDPPFPFRDSFPLDSSSFNHHDSLSTISDSCDNNTHIAHKLHFIIMKDISKMKKRKIEQQFNGNECHLFKVLNKKRADVLLESVYDKEVGFKGKGTKGQRKFKPDDIRKKIKARFHKILKDVLNEMLVKAGAKKKFGFLPQCFIANISKKLNHYAMGMTIREIFQKDFWEMAKESKSTNKRIDKRKQKNNLEVLEYLDRNVDICEKSGFSFFEKKRYCDVLKEYFMSEEFLNSVNRLKYERESDDYINEYKKKAFDYVSFFSSK